MLWRIHQHVLTMLAGQLWHPQAPGTLGIDAASLWIVARRHDGSIAVGSSGDALMSPDDVAKAIKEYQAMIPDLAKRDTVGL